jgi:hypothetical protein
MVSKKAFISIFICIIVMFLVCGMAGNAQSQVYPFNPFLAFNPYLFSFPPLPSAYAPSIFPAYPSLLNAASLVPVPPVLTPRIGAATIIIANPTAGTVTVVNPTVATAPAVATTVAPASPPLLSLLGTIYASALYEGLLSTANPLLFALLQNLFL